MQIRKRKSCQTSPFQTKIFLFLVLILFFSQSYAESTQEMMLLAQDYILKHIDAHIHNPAISLTPLSQTAKTPKCEQPIKIQWNNKQKTGNINLSLVCIKPKWQRYISAKISGELPVVIASKDIALGSDIQLSDVHLGWLPDAQVRVSHLTTLNDIEQFSTRQFVPAGSALASNQIRMRVLIHKGDHVRILAGYNGIAIEMSGTALESGEKGKQIRVQNDTSGKIIKGNVTSVDSIIVP